MNDGQPIMWGMCLFLLVVFIPMPMEAGMILTFLAFGLVILGIAKGG